MKKVNDSQTKNNDMTKTEARKAINTIKNNMCSLMETCYEFETRNGYAALGYKSFKECVEIELVGVIKYDYAIKMKNAGQVHLIVCPEIPMGEVSEGVLRQLYRLTDAKRKAVWNAAVRKCGGDYTEVTEPMITEIIEAKGLAAPVKDDKANGPKDVLDPKIILKARLQKEMRLTVLELLQENATGNKHRPASKEYFEAALNSILDDLFHFLSGHYKSLYGE